MVGTRDCLATAVRELQGAHVPHSPTRGVHPRVMGARMSTGFTEMRSSLCVWHQGWGRQWLTCTKPWVAGRALSSLTPVIHSGEQTQTQRHRGAAGAWLRRGWARTCLSASKCCSCCWRFHWLCWMSSSMDGAPWAGGMGAAGASGGCGRGGMAAAGSSSGVCCLQMTGGRGGGVSRENADGGLGVPLATSQSQEPPSPQGLTIYKGLCTASCPHKLSSSYSWALPSLSQDPSLGLPSSGCPLLGEPRKSPGHSCQHHPVLAQCPSGAS